jgi:serine/threonine-protein kinase
MAVCAMTLLGRRSLPLLFAFAASLAVPSAARAQNASDQAAAEALFHDGRKLYDEGRYPEACAKLAESQRLDPAPGTLLNLAGCYEKNGQTASAWATFKSAMSAAHQKGRADWEELARERAAALEPTLSKLTLVVEAPTDGLVVRRDGEEVGRAEWGTPIPVDPGTHVIDASAPQRRPYKQSIDVGARGATATVTVRELARAASAGGGAPAEAPHDGATQRIVGLALAGAGVVGLGVSAVYGLVAMNRENDALNYECNPQGLCTPHGVQLGQDAKSAATASTIAFGLGAAAVAGGLVLYFSAPRRSTAPATVGLRVAPTHGGGSFRLEAAW